MPVKPYYSQKEPAGDAVIWRFMDLRKFRDLMASEELYFRRADLFEDETEGIPPDQYVQRVLDLNPLDLSERREINNHLGLLAQHREMHYITCWYLYDQETLKMWEGYGHDGIAIVSRYDLLKAALDTLIDDTHIGLVQYGTAHLTNRFNALEFITTKQAKYEHECEVRAVLTCTDPLAGGNRHIDLNNVLHPRPLPMNPRHPWFPDCKRRRIVLKDLLQDVVISPWAEADNVEEIELWNERRSLSAPRNSDLRDLQDAYAGRISEAHGNCEAATGAGANGSGTRASAFLRGAEHAYRGARPMIVPAALGQVLFGTGLPTEHIGRSVSRRDIEGFKGHEEMTPEERRKRPEHHVVHDYANLVSSGLLRRSILRCCLRLG